MIDSSPYERLCRRKQRPVTSERARYRCVGCMKDIKKVKIEMSVTTRWRQENGCEGSLQELLVVVQGLKKGKRVGKGVGWVAVRKERSSIRSRSSCAGGRRVGQWSRCSEVVMDGKRGTVPKRLFRSNPCIGPTHSLQ